ncbi:hypothetical protein [Tsukamurella pseudospumae]|uniref:DUF4878 domain-containing protein n=1 Tax=Tsukamurella pseudospumae TaxID=239498 RepID=A0A138A7R6_9ACTN|nr:hypothetical protein [Tsukamurella pseudospumae]KXO99240.1 hypothetical protein AXK61_18425 [Tsukamurella pseudospumae]KXP06407.1 hypothetical protein AXK60_09935 [Tsukamurella pseudospumae]
MNRTPLRACTAVGLAAFTAITLAACGDAKSDAPQTSPEEQIKQVTTTYVQGQSGKDADKLRATSCKEMIDQEISTMNDEGNPQSVTLDGIADVKVDGDKATAQVTMTATFAGKPQQKKTGTFEYVKEDGWRVCLR